MNEDLEVKKTFTPEQMLEMADRLEGMRGSLKAEHGCALAADMLRQAAQSLPPTAGEVEVTSSWNPQDGPYEPSALKMPDGIPPPMAFRDAFAAMATVAGDNDALKRLDPDGTRFEERGCPSAHWELTGAPSASTDGRASLEAGELRQPAHQSRAKRRWLCHCDQANSADAEACVGCHRRRGACEMELLPQERTDPR